MLPLFIGLPLIIAFVIVKNLIEAHQEAKNKPPVMPWEREKAKDLKQKDKSR